jgi:hypothetical protein
VPQSIPAALILDLLMWTETSLQNNVGLTPNSDLSMSTKEAVQNLQVDSTKELGIVGYISSRTEDIHQSLDVVLKQKIPSLQDHLSLKIDNSSSRIETAVSRSSTAVSQSFESELDQRLPALETSLMNTTNQQSDALRNSIEAAVHHSTAEIKQAIDTYTRQQSMVLASQQHYFGADSTGLPLSGSTLLRPKNKRSPWAQGLKREVLSGCNCNPNVGRTSLNHSYGVKLFCKLGFKKKSESLLVHKRSCPVWYRSQIITEWGVDILIHRFKIFGSFCISSSPYSSILEWKISQNLSYGAVVPISAPAFSLIDQYLRNQPKSDDGGRWAARCCYDLSDIFYRGLGSPTDSLCNGMTLIDVSGFPSCFGPVATTCSTPSLEKLVVTL